MYTYLDHEGQAQIGEIQSPSLTKELSGQYKGVDDDVWETDVQQDPMLQDSHGAKFQHQEAPVLQQVLHDLLGGSEQDGPEDKKRSSPVGVTQDPCDSALANEDNSKPSLQKRDKNVCSGWSGSSGFELLDLTNTNDAGGYSSLSQPHALTKNRSIDSTKTPLLERQPSKDDGLAAALEQIRQMEEMEKLKKSQAEDVKEYLVQGEHVY